LIYPHPDYLIFSCLSPTGSPQGASLRVSAGTGEGGQTMMRDPSTGSGQSASGLQYFLTDNLGSTVAITDSNGTLTSQQRYLPFGGTRTNVTTPNSPGTDFGYTGQRQLGEGMGGLMNYKARFYSPMLGRFIQPDSITPGGPQGLNRYSYVGNNPINFNDPTGHMMSVGEGGGGCSPCTKLDPPISDPDEEKDKEDEERCTYQVGCSTTDPIDSIVDSYQTGWENFG